MHEELQTTLIVEPSNDGAENYSTPYRVNPRNETNVYLDTKDYDNRSSVIPCTK